MLTGEVSAAKLASLEPGDLAAKSLSEIPNIVCDVLLSPSVKDSTKQQLSPTPSDTASKKLPKIRKLTPAPVLVSFFGQYFRLFLVYTFWSRLGIANVF